MFKHYLTMSRPRLWAYLLVPYLIGLAVGGRVDGWLVLLALYFSYPANFIVYGTEDVYDYEAGKRDGMPKETKQLVKPDKGWRVMRQVLGWLVVGYLLLEFVPGHHDAAQWGLLGFFFFGLMYSMPPVRARDRWALGWIFKGLFILFPALVSYGVATGNFPSWPFN